MSHPKKSVQVRAVPPKNYICSIFDWCNELKLRRLWDGINPKWYGDVMITETEWLEMVKACEGVHSEDKIN